MPGNADLGPVTCDSGGQIASIGDPWLSVARGKGLILDGNPQTSLVVDQAVHTCSPNHANVVLRLLELIQILYNNSEYLKNALFLSFFFFFW